MAGWRGNRRVYDGERGRKEGKGVGRGIERERGISGIDARREGEEEREREAEEEEEEEEEGKKRRGRGGGGEGGGRGERG